MSDHSEATCPAWRAAFQAVLSGESLTVDASEAAMREIMTGSVPEGGIAGYLVALRLKGETPEEVVGAARAMREASTRIQPNRTPLVDTCGTGGDEAGTLNLSTAAALVAAAAGIAVAKHGNRSVSSKCGSADVLEAWGIASNLEPDAAVASINAEGFAFLFSPRFHPAMRHAMGARRALATRTIFNLLGPLTNPAGAKRQVIGVYSSRPLELVARALHQLGTDHAYVLHSHDGLDEFSLSAPTDLMEVRPQGIVPQTLTPEDLGLRRAPREAIAGQDATYNAARLGEVFAGAKGPIRDAVVANAALAFVVAGRVASPEEGAREAERVLDSGSVAQLVVRLQTRAEHPDSAKGPSA